MTMNPSHILFRIFWVSAAGLLLSPLVPSPLAPSPLAFSQDTENRFSVSAAVDRQHIQVADPFEFSITVVVPNDVSVQFPSATKTIGLFEVISVSDQFDIPSGSDTPSGSDIPSGSGRIWKRIYGLETLESGALEIPPQTIQVGEQSVLTEAIGLKVCSSITDDADPLQPQPLKGPIEIPFPEPGGNWATPLVVGISALAVAAWLIYGARKPKALNSKNWAMRRLGEIRQSSDFQNRRSEVVLPQLAELVREYIHRRFGIAAPRLTTDEFLQMARTHPRLGSLQQNELDEFLVEVDRVKFANLQPSDDRIDVAVHRVIHFVEVSSETIKMASSAGQQESGGGD